MLTTPLDFREKMIEARRTQILLGAAQVFAQKGFHGATIKEVAQAAEVAEGTIYNCFTDKFAEFHPAQRATRQPLQPTPGG